MTYSDQFTRVIAELNRTAVNQFKAGNMNEYLRLTGKVEGVQLGLAMAEDEIKRLESELARAELENMKGTQ